MHTKQIKVPHNQYVYNIHTQQYDNIIVIPSITVTCPETTTQLSWMPIQSETRPSVLLIEPRNSEYMISVEVQYQWLLQYVTSYQYSRSPQHTHKSRGRGSVPVAPATCYFVLLLNITTAHTQGQGKSTKQFQLCFSLTRCTFPYIHTYIM